MAANISPIFVAAANVAEVTFVSADGTTAKDLLEAGTNGSKVLAIACTTDDDTADVVLDLFIHDGSTAYLVGSGTVPQGAGTDGGTTPAVNLLDADAMPWLDSDGELFIPSGYKLQVAPQAAVTAAKTATVVCLGGDY